MNQLYLPSGYLNIKNIEKAALRDSIAFIIMIGGRQVGKTYGTLKLMLDEKKRFILMRRTQTEIDFISSGNVNPFLPLGRPDIGIKKASRYHGEILQGEPEDHDVIGLTLALSTVSKIRGFSGVDYTDLVFDEFIPENHVMRIKDEGDAFLNAIVTISGNRELEDKPPLRTWLLANSNNLNSPILSALNVMEKVEQMKRKGQELSILPERSLMIVLPTSEHILEKRKETALVKAAGTNSRFFDMAFGNEFSYNDSENVKAIKPAGRRPILSVRGAFTLYRIKGKESYHIDEFIRDIKLEFTDSEVGSIKLLNTFPGIREAYYTGRIAFQTQTLKERFKSYFKFT